METEARRSLEQCIIAAMLLEPRAAGEAFTRLSSWDFTDARHAYLFDAMRTIDRAGYLIDPLTLQERLLEDETFLRTGGRGYIIFLMDAVPSAGAIDHHITLLLDAHPEPPSV